MSNRDLIAYLTVRTWVGSCTVFDAQHYYGRIDFLGEDVEIDRPLTPQEAKRLNKEARDRGDDHVFKYRKGEMCGRFWDEQIMRAVAREVWARECKPKGSIGLLEGDRAVRDPLPVIAGFDGYADQMNALNAKADEIGRWGDSKREAEMESVSKAWNQLKDEACQCLKQT